MQNDEIINDNEIRVGTLEELLPGDTASIRFISMHKASYGYFDKISQINQQDGNNIVLFNPIGNFGPEVPGFNRAIYRTVIVE